MAIDDQSSECFPDLLKEVPGLQIQFISQLFSVSMVYR